MLYPDLVAAEVLMERVVAERLREAENYRLLCEIRASRRNWLFRQCCWLLVGFGRLLVALGQRLQQYGSARPVSLSWRR